MAQAGGAETINFDEESNVVGRLNEMTGAKVRRNASTRLDWKPTRLGSIDVPCKTVPSKP